MSSSFALLVPIAFALPIKLFLFKSVSLLTFSLFSHPSMGGGGERVLSCWLDSTHHSRTLQNLAENSEFCGLECLLGRISQHTVIDLGNMFVFTRM